MRFFIVVLIFLLSSCVGVPEGISPVENFDKNKYLGKWYEIARFDHSFERGLEAISAHYSVREDGGVKVINRGFNSVSNEWEEAEGKAYFVGEENIGHLKVSFFGPFYGSYVVFDLGNDYEYSFVTSNDRSFLWLLSRSSSINPELKKYFIEKISSLGFDKNKLIFINHSYDENETGISGVVFDDKQ